MSKLDGLDKGYEDMFAPIVEFKDEVEELNGFLDNRDMFNDIVDFDYKGKTHIKMDPISKLNSQYKHGEIEPLDVMEEQGWLEGFCYGNIIKYAMRRKGSDKEDLQKIIDYAKILMAEEK